MYVKKFEAETLDGALQEVKRELGPDAIILKTVTNKGLKGAFKKSRIEITAAISEQNYVQKKNVDHVLDEKQQSQFYQQPASQLKNDIGVYNENRPASARGYGNMGLNKVVNSVSKASKKIQNSLDDFLTVSDNERSGDDLRGFLAQEESYEAVASHAEITAPTTTTIEFDDSKLNAEIRSQSHQIELLEKKLYDITQKISQAPSEDDESPNLAGLRVTLRSLNLSEKIIVDIIKKAAFELTPEDLEDADVIYEFALREINSFIKVGMPLFSQSDMSEKQVVTVLVSEGANGQASMAMKLAVLQEDIKIIQFRTNSHKTKAHDFTTQMFDIDICTVETLSHLMSEARKAISNGQSLILDLKLNFSENDETKKFLEILRRSFENVEILTTVSAINSETYNRKILSKYNSFANGVIISYVDQCLDFGSLVNLNYEFNDLPMKFYGTGAVVPDDIEAATSERLLAGMFNF